MNRFVWIPLSLMGIITLAVLALPACNSIDRPVAPGQVSNSAPSNCNGVLGDNTIEPQVAAVSDLWFDPIVPTSNTYLESIALYIGSSTSTPVTYEAGIYSNNATGPSALLEETGIQTMNGPATLWNITSLKNSVSLSAGVTYWLAFQVSNDGYRYNTATTAYSYQPAGAFGSLPANFSGTNSSGFVLSIYGVTCP